MANKLELTWYGKENEISVEPRLLIERPELSNTDNDPDTENMLIHGDNLLALKALESKYAGQVKCIYIVIWTNIMISTLGIYKCLNTFFCFESHGYSHRFIERVSRPLACISALTPSR